MSGRRHSGRYGSSVDIQVWLATGIAVIAACIAAWQAYEARKARKDTVKYAQESAEAATRSADAAERALVLQEAQMEAAKPLKVAWRVEHTRNRGYRLRNIGTDPATGVTAEDPRGPGLARQLPENASIQANAAVEILLLVAGEYPDPSELLVRWDGVERPVVVPVPPG